MQLNRLIFGIRLASIATLLGAVVCGSAVEWASRTGQGTSAAVYFCLTLLFLGCGMCGLWLARGSSRTLREWREAGRP